MRHLVYVAVLVGSACGGGTGASVPDDAPATPDADPDGGTEPTPGPCLPGSALDVTVPLARFTTAITANGGPVPAGLALDVWVTSARGTVRLADTTVLAPGAYDL
jgi:hypothetical protein